VIEDTDANLYVAIDRAADRAWRTLARQVERRRGHRHNFRRNARAGDALVEREVTHATPAASGS
jgi:ribosome-associated translation inhibitor RaiA